MERSLTDDCADAWLDMGIKPVYQVERLRDWANMLEARVKELDPNYRYFHWGERTLLAQSSGQTMDNQLTKVG